MGLHARRRAALGGAVAVAALALALVLALRGGGAQQPPPDRAARLVPAGALAYLHLATDPGRDGVARARRLAGRFAAYKGLRDTVLGRLGDARCGVDVARSGGHEVALALIDSGQAGRAGSLIVFDGPQARAAPARRTCGSLEVRRLGDLAVLGQPATVAIAARLARGGRGALADDPTYRRARAGLPPGRVLDGYLPSAGLRRVLAPQSGLLGAAGVLLDQPALRGVGFALEAGTHGARLTVHEALDPAGRRPGPFRPFSPSLDARVPAGALGYVGVRGIGPAAERLAALAGGDSALGGVVGRLRSALGGAAGRRLRALFSGESALALTPAVPAPVLTVVVRADDEKAARAAMADLQAPLAKAFAPGGGSAQAPTFDELALGDTTAYRLRLAPGLELDYAVFDHLLVLSTAIEGIRGVRSRGRRLPDSGAFRSVLGDAPGQVSSLIFLDFSELLRLGEQTGLGESRAFRRSEMTSRGCGRWGPRRPATQTIRPCRWSFRSHDPVRRQRVPVHLGVRDRGASRQGRRPDLRRRPRRRPERRPVRARGVRDAREHGPGGRLG